MPEQKHSGLSTNYDLTDLDGLELDQQPSLDVLMRSGGMNLSVHDNKNAGRIKISTATQTAIQRLMDEYNTDENKLLMNLAVIGHYACLKEIDDEVESFSKNVTAFPYNVSQENMSVRIQGDVGKTIWFSPYKNTLNFAKRIEEKVTGTQKTYLRMFLNRGIIETGVSVKVEQAVREEYEAIRHALENYMEDKRQEYQGKRIIEELGLDETKLESMNKIESIEQLKEAKSL